MPDEVNLDCVQETIGVKKEEVVNSYVFSNTLADDIVEDGLSK